MRRDTAAPCFEQVPFRAMRLLAVESVVRIAIWRIMFRGVRCVLVSVLVLGWFLASCEIKAQLDPETMRNVARNVPESMNNL